MFFEEAEGVFTLHLWVTPKSASDDLSGLSARPDGRNALCVKVRALPDKGAANKAVIATLAKALKVPKSDIALVAGETSRAKTVRIATLKESVDDIRQRLEALAKT